jgi:hypothetical protein
MLAFLRQLWMIILYSISAMLINIGFTNNDCLLKMKFYMSY